MFGSTRPRESLSRNHWWPSPKKWKVDVHIGWPEGVALIQSWGWTKRQATRRLGRTLDEFISENEALLAEHGISNEGST